MSWILVCLFAFALPTAAGFALIGAWRAARWLGEARRKAPPPQPIERLEADLRRLRSQLEDTENQSGLIGKHHRVQALRGAYVDALSAACRRLDISPPPGGDRAAQAEIYRVEVALRQRGVDVRQDIPETAAP